MNLSEKLYQLRKQEGLSQEQAAEALGVSRQAVSKWENDTSMPEADKLAAISRFYGVTIDYLLLEDVSQANPISQEESKRSFSRLGLLLCLLGNAGLLLWGIVTVFLPDTADQLNASSAVTLQGSGLLAIGCVIALAAGTVLLLQKHK